MEDVIELITKLLEKGERIRNSGLGILQARKRAALMDGRPAAGEAIVKASKRSDSDHKELKLTI